MARKSAFSKLQVTAYHEAGHAVVAHVLHRGLASITIVPDEDEDTLGLCQYLRSRINWEGADWAPTTRQRSYLERAILTVLAGAEAEHALTGRRGHLGASHDYTQAVDCALIALGGDAEEASLFLGWMAYRARKLLQQPQNWHAVEALSRELMVHRTLSGRRTRAIIRQAIRTWADEQLRQLGEAPGPAAHPPPRAMPLRAASP